MLYMWGFPPLEQNYVQEFCVIYISSTRHLEPLLLMPLLLPTRKPRAFL